MAAKSTCILELDNCPAPLKEANKRKKWKRKSPSPCKRSEGNPIALLFPLIQKLVGAWCLNLCEG